PGDMGLGEVSSDFVNDGNPLDTYSDTVDNDVGFEDFTTLNVIFSPDGSVVTQINGQAPVLYENSPAFVNKAGEETRIWKYNAALVNERGIRVMTCFNYKELKASVTRTPALDESGQYLVVNRCTGQLFPVE
ncbi:hypothetical protein LCGC14_1261330, partial [marine sediment metagenome]